jgi:hypothetical protein
VIFGETICTFDRLPCSSLRTGALKYKGHGVPHCRHCLQRIRISLPAKHDTIEAVSMPIFTLPNKAASSNAMLAIKSAMVNPIPARQPAPSTCPIAWMDDLYALTTDADKVLTF